VSIVRPPVERHGRIAVVGLGKLGACMAACFAAKGWDVTGVDVSPATVDALNAGRAPVPEPGLQELLAAARGRLRATHVHADAVAGADLTFVVVPTPSLSDGRFSLEFVRPAVRAIGEALRGRREPHVVVVTSTVLPGSMEFGVQPVLEAAAGRKVGAGPDDGLGLVYNPEFIALGTVVRDFLAPDLVLVGESDPASGARVAAVYERVCENRPRVARMNFASAELAKIALNSFVTTKISFSNMLVELCEALPGADVDAVCGALGHDSRIGSRALRGGLGYGGPCFPRDSVALAALARALGHPAAIAEAVDRVNDQVVPRVAALARKRLPPGGRTAVLGLAYKAGTPIVERAHGLAIARELVEGGGDVVVWDAMANGAAQSVLGDRVAWGATADAALEEADVAVLAALDADLAATVARALARRTKPLILIDCWRLLADAKLPATVRRVAVGVGEPTPARNERLKALWT
jgi:UDPglucose 6-dehydrogenase